MIFKYVLKNFSRRKVRTILMILSLLVSTGLIVAMSATVETMRQSNVDLIASAVGRYDLAVQKTGTSSDLFLVVDEVRPHMLAASDQITAVYPRLESEIEFTAPNGGIGSGTLLALDPAVDDIGFVDVVEGTYALGARQTAVLQETALNFNLAVGDTVDIAYSFPLPREAGQPEPAGASQRRTTERFTITGIVRQDGVTDSGIRAGFIISLADAQAWLSLPGRAQRLVATVNPALYETNNAEVAALRVRDVLRAVQARLGDDYTYSLVKAAALDGLAEGFLAIQALINTYGLISLGIVGLLVHTLVMTNVQEQRRDMAVLRILGSQRNVLFGLVIVEVMVIGAVGVGLGVGLGQLITAYIVVPIIESQFAVEGLNPSLTPALSLSAVLPAILSAFVVLLISSIKPAQDAARTKVMHAINPGVADNIQLEDLAQLRERRPSLRLFFTGLALMLIFGLIAGFQILENFGGPALQVTFILLALGLLVLGLGLIFFITTVPFERLVLLVMRLIFPRVTYFARRNVGRGQLRNTLISLLVLFSGVLPSFLATQLALENANFETSIRLNMGAPVNMTSFWSPRGGEHPERQPASFVQNELRTVAGFEQIVSLSYQYESRATDTVGLRWGNVAVYGVDGRLQDVLFPDMVEFAAGSPAALDDILSTPDGVIISEGLAEHLALGLGDVVKLRGEGLDHTVNARILGIARRLPGIDGISRSRLEARDESGVLMSVDSFRGLITPLNEPPPPRDAPLFVNFLATLAPSADEEAMSAEIGERYGRDYGFWAQFLTVRLESNARQQASQRIFLLVLTVISFTTAVFGVFAVIYVTIYARRLEIGMLKAVGMLRRELTGMLIVEAITMTLGAALAGIAAGASMGYVSFYGQRALQQQPVSFAIDTTVMPFIVFMVVLASMLGAAFSARRIVKKQAVDILRMQ
ncbi:MAG: ABC transporter permease [Anaerolineales bacterium]|nr:ABC transporter permease [Anaerolineales bacterium]